MYIESLHIADFSGTVNRDITLSDGINIIEGSNESGKSTLAAFISFIFYGFRDKAERQRYYGWDKSSASGSAVVVLDQKRYRIERQHIENSGDRVSIIDLQTNLPAFEGQTPGEVFFGVSADIFDQTAFVGQSSGGYINGARVSSSIENILFSADETVDTSAALKRLDEARVLLRHKRGKGGKLYDLACERDEVLKRLDAAKASNGGIIEKEGSLRETKRSIEQNEEKLQYHKDLLEYYEAAKQYRTYKKYKQLKKKASELEALVTALETGYTHDGFIPDEEYINGLAAIEDEISRLDEAAAELHRETEQRRNRSGDLFEMSLFIDKVNEKGGIDRVVDGFGRINKARKLFGIFSVISFVLAVLAGVATALMFLNSSSFFIYCGIAALVFTVLGIAFVICSGRQKINMDEFLAELDIDSKKDFRDAVNRFVSDENKLSLHNSRMRELEDKYEKLLSARKEKEDIAMAEALRWGKNDPKEALKKAREVVKLIGDNKNEAEKYTLARDAFKEQAESLDPVALKQILAGRPYTEDAFDMTEVESALRENDFYSKATACLRQKEAELEKELAVLYATVENPTVLGDRLNYLDRTINELTKKHNAFLLAYEKLTEASEKLRMGVSPTLAGRAGSILEEMTRGKYKTLGVTNTLDMRYESEGSSHDIAYMSAGTRDLAYYALRIALVELLYKKQTPPLIFDESFARLDGDRLEGMLTAIGSQQWQSLVFTAQTRDALALKGISIPFNHIIL